MLGNEDSGPLVNPPYRSHDSSCGNTCKSSEILPVWFQQSGKSSKTLFQFHVYSKHDIRDSFLSFDIYYKAQSAIKYTQF